MTIDIYAAHLVVETDGTKGWANVVPMEGDSDRLKKDADAAVARGEDAFEPNPDYMPHSHMSMCESNFQVVLQYLGIRNLLEDSNQIEILEMFKKAHDFLANNYHDVEIYLVERAFGLREMARLGISRGATHIVWS